MSRRRSPLLALSAAALLLAAGCSDATPKDVPFDSRPDQAVAVTARIDREEVALLAPVELTIDVWSAPKTELDFDPKVPDGFVGTVAKAPPSPLFGGTWQRWTLVLRPSKTGDRTIPAFTAKAGEAEASTTPFEVKVKSALGDADPAAVEAPAPPFPARTDWTPWIFGGGALLLLLAAVLLWRRLRPSREKAPPTAEDVPAHIRALRALARLRKTPRNTAAEIEAFYVAVSQVLRVYLEERFGLRAPERTTEEFLLEIKDSPALNADQRMRVAEFLQRCDLVKFARHLPPEPVHEETFAVAEQLVEATRPDRHQEGAA